MKWKEEIKIKQLFNGEVEWEDIGGKSISPDLHAELITRLRKSKILSSNTEAVRYIDMLEKEDDIEVIEGMIWELIGIAAKEKVHIIGE